MSDRCIWRRVGGVRSCSVFSLTFPQQTVSKNISFGQFGNVSLTGWCSTLTLLLICSSFSRGYDHPLLICSSLSTAQLSAQKLRTLLHQLKASGYPSTSSKDSWLEGVVALPRQMTPKASAWHPPEKPPKESHGNPLMVSGTHTIHLFLGILMGMVWE